MDVAEKRIALQQRAPTATLSAWLPIAATLILIVVLYMRAMRWWYFEWTRAGSFYAHGVFIPFFVAIMIWYDRDKIRELPLGRSWWGLTLVVFAAIVAILSMRAEVTFTLSLSFIALLVGATLLAAGARVTRSLLFPLLFLLTMIPIVPEQLINYVAFPIQLVSSKMAATIFNLTGFETARIGTQIAMPDYKLDVELPCSGFKTLLGLLAFSAAFAYVVEAPKWKQWVLFAASAPLALLVNGIRITLIGYVGELFGGPAAARFHDFSGFIVLIVGFLFLFSFARMLKCTSFLGVPLADPPKQKPAAADGGTETTPPSDPSQAASTEPRPAPRFTLDGASVERVARHLSVGLYPVVAILLLTCLARPAVTQPHPLIPAVQAQDIPALIGNGEWRKDGADIPIEPSVQATLEPLSFINRDYVSTRTDGGHAELLLTSGNGRKVFHDPHTCFLNSGYYMHDVRTETIASPAGPLTVQVAEAENTRDHSTSLLMFCYVVDGKQLQTIPAVNTAIIMQMIVGDTGRPSYFLRFRNLQPGTGNDRAEELRSFIRAIWTQIEPAVGGSR